MTAAEPQTKLLYWIERIGEINMRVELTRQECKWLADLANKAKIEAIHCNEEMPNRIFELRRDNMADLENKLNTAVQKQIQKERKDAR